MYERMLMDEMNELRIDDLFIGMEVVLEVKLGYCSPFQSFRIRIRASFRLSDKYNITAIVFHYGRLPLHGGQIREDFIFHSSWPFWLGNIGVLRMERLNANFQRTLGSERGEGMIFPYPNLPMVVCVMGSCFLWRSMYKRHFSGCDCLQYEFMRKFTPFKNRQRIVITTNHLS